MENLPNPFSRLLIPYDGSPYARQALAWAAHLCRGNRLMEHLTVLRVIGGGYLARHIQNVDLRVTRMDQVKEWQRVRRHYIEHDITPQLEEAQKLLQGHGVTVPIETRIAEGQVGTEIVKLAEAEGFTTIIMGRRGLSAVKELLLGGVTRSVLYQAQGVTVFVVSSEVSVDPDCPVTPLLLPVDGSEPSLAAVRQAAALAQAFAHCPVHITLLHVLDIALLSMELETGASRLVKEAEALLTQSRHELKEAGFAGPLAEKLFSGRPPHTIVAVAQEGGYPLILLGHTGRSPVKNLLMGSVASDVVHRASQAIVGLVCL
jgi:nucleotide-binding universal stress UspA family protein